MGGGVEGGVEAEGFQGPMTWTAMKPVSQDWAGEKHHGVVHFCYFRHRNHAPAALGRHRDSMDQHQPGVWDLYNRKVWRERRLVVRQGYVSDTCSISSEEYANVEEFLPQVDLEPQFKSRQCT